MMMLALLFGSAFADDGGEIACHSHADCPASDPFCLNNDGYEIGHCNPCDECHSCFDGIDLTCGAACGQHSTDGEVCGPWTYAGSPGHCMANSPSDIGAATEPTSAAQCRERCMEDETCVAYDIDGTACRGVFSMPTGIDHSGMGGCYVKTKALSKWMASNHPQRELFAVNDGPNYKLVALAVIFSGVALGSALFYCRKTPYVEVTDETPLVQAA